MTEIPETPFAELRREMVEQIVRHAAQVGAQTGRPSLAPRVLETMLDVPRHEFVPAELRAFAYLDSPLPIGYDKTISQPFIVALMTDLLDVSPGDRVLDVGTGLGYQAAILARLGAKVYTIEIIEELAHSAARRLREQQVPGIVATVGDGSVGWAEHAPFDRILVAAAPELIPTPLLTQLAPGGRMVIPAGIENAQQLMLVEKSPAGALETREVLAVRFSPLMTAEDLA